jgi:hypothetical protein
MAREEGISMEPFPAKEASIAMADSSCEDKFHNVGLQDPIPYLATPFLAQGTCDDHMNVAAVGQSEPPPLFRHERSALDFTALRPYAVVALATT